MQLTQLFAALILATSTLALPPAIRDFNLQEEDTLSVRNPQTPNDHPVHRCDARYYREYTNKPKKDATVAYSKCTQACHMPQTLSVSDFNTEKTLSVRNHPNTQEYTLSAHESLAISDVNVKARRSVCEDKCNKSFEEDTKWTNRN